ncbi:hypothetical protein ALO85_101881 [Pseudomonas syringae pv. aptata]|uniref:hypothetical protein n=1 Tax=Pseudomonas syringae TaxID=317 RepID=UPI0006E5C30B|nr:hypothetical protein [Pseudomonas syringae]KPY97906.1 hypothetical protein ALO85_101881 [Pseudomonas syringae pv. aptata]
MKDSYKLIASLNKDQLRPFLDEKKIILSYGYSQAVAYCVEHSEKYGDYSQLGALVNVFEGRDFRLFVSAWLCERLGLKSKMAPHGAVFARNGNAPNSDMSFKVSVEAFAGSKFKIQVPVKPVKPAVAKEKKTPKRVDMLDSWARLPGSFGHGKR